MDAGREAGSVQSDAIRNIDGTIYAYMLNMGNGVAPTGALGLNTSQQGLYSTGTSGFGGEFTFDASRDVPTSNENRPANIAQPLVIYLGLSA